VAEKKLSQISDATEIMGVIKQVIADNAEAVLDYASGKQQALTFIIGQVMKATKGRANPAMVREILIQELGGK
jgi:aspartyl-tRNA(Asn)/glutamyl-tRNA(Gln) amidotransferase subunit B